MDFDVPTLHLSLEPWTMQTLTSNVPHTSTMATQDPTSLPVALSGYSQLPPELRELIWTFICPDIDIETREQPHVFQIFICYSNGPTAPNLGPPRLRGGFFLARQTQALRTVLRINRETRALATRMFPDTFTIDHDKAGLTQGLVRFNRERDIVLIHDRVSYPLHSFHSGLQPSLAFSATWVEKFSSEVRNVALGLGFDRISSNVKTLTAIHRNMQDLKTLYIAYSETDPSQYAVNRTSLLRHFTLLLADSSAGQVRHVEYWWNFPGRQSIYPAKFIINGSRESFAKFNRTLQSMEPKVRAMSYRGYSARDEEARQLYPNVVQAYASICWTMLVDFAGTCAAHV